MTSWLSASGTTWPGFNVDVPAISYRDSEYYFSIAEYVDKRRGIVPGSFAIARRPGEILSFEVLQPLT